MKENDCTVSQSSRMTHCRVFLNIIDRKTVPNRQVSRVEKRRCGDIKMIENAR